MILKTLVGRVRWYVWAHDRTYQRMRSEFIKMVNVNEDRKACIHAGLIEAMSAQLRFPG